MPVMTDPSVVVKLTPALLEMMKAEGTVAAGLSTKAAAAQLGFKFVKGVGYVKTYTTTATAVGSAVTAGEAIAGAGAATGAAESASVTATLVTAADGTTKIMGLGTIALEAGALVLAGAAGYMAGDAIGDLIDSAYPDFFDGLFSSVSEFLTGDEHGLAFLFDSDGHAYMQQDAVDEVSKYLRPKLENSTSFIKIEDFNLPYANVVADGRIFTFSDYGDKEHEYYNITKFISTESEKPIKYCTYYDNVADSFSHIFACETPFKIKAEESVISRKDGHVRANFGINWHPDIKTTTQLNGKEFYAVSFSRGSLHGCLNEFGPLLPLEYFHWAELKTRFPKITTTQIMYYLLYGDKVESGVPNLKKYEVPTKPKITVGDKTYTRVPLPEPSKDPTKMPTKIPVLEPEEKPEPEKIPQYIYVPMPTPTPAPTPLPTVDPSTEPEPLPDIDPVKPIPRPPVPTPTPTPQPPLPVPPPISSEATGLLHVYNPTNSEINEFGAWLWTTFSGDLIDTLGKLFNNPMDAVIGLHELYCTPITGEPATIKAGFLESDTTSRLVTKRYTEINCGALVVPEHWGNYLDYTPYTKVYCYLPFIGIVELNADDIIGHGVQVLYKIDTYNGSCIAMIITAKTSDVEVVKYQFSGNCAVEVPITSGMKSAMQSALIGAGTCAIGAAIGGAVVPVIAGMAVNNSVKSGFSNKNTVSHSGSFGSSYGAMGIKKPYIIVKRPIQKVVNGYNDKYGYPAHEMVTIGKCSGYLRCRDFDVQSSTATEDEKKLIETLLKQGVYV